MNYLKYIIILSITFQLLNAQDQNSIKEIEDLLFSIRFNRGEILYPDEFYEFKQRYEDLIERNTISQFTNNEIREIKNILHKLHVINQAADKAKPYFNSIYSVRDDAQSSGAMDFAPGLYEKAEDKMRKLALQIREEIPQNIDDQITEISSLYNKAQFEAIRNKLLSEVRILIEESKDLDAHKHAPRTFELVEGLLQNVELILKKNGFDDPTLQDKASLLLTESQHLLFLARLNQRVNRIDPALEEYLLNLENSISRICEHLNYSPQYSAGIQPVLKNLLLSVEEVVAENENLRNSNTQLKDSIANLKKNLLESKNQLTEKRNVTQNINILVKKLSGEGIRVTELDSQIVLRLNGISFSPGRVQIAEPYKGKLEKIGKALQHFQSESISIRLGQFADGNIAYNKSLADQRAKAVALVIQTAAYIPDSRIKSEGIILNGNVNNSHAIIEVIVTP